MDCRPPGVNICLPGAILKRLVLLQGQNNISHNPPLRLVFLPAFVTPGWIPRFQSKRRLTLLLHGCIFFSCFSFFMQNHLLICQTATAVSAIMELSIKGLVIES